MRTFAFGLALVAACSGNAPSGNSPDGGAACTMAIYDPCATEHDCMAGTTCRTFSTTMPALEVCTQACTSAQPCPNDSSGAPGTCDSTLMLCRPAKANACTPAL
jgi:hypothetical protein